MPAAVPRSAPPTKEAYNREITEAVRDTVTVRGNTETPPRSRLGRSQTALNPPNTSTRPPGRRSQSQDSAVLADKSKPSSKPRPKKGSQHADVIDRLDFTGVGPMFHHDGPFDACAPSRNKLRNKAPMFAWSARPEEAAPQYGDSAYPAAHAYSAFTDNHPDPPKKKVDAIAEAWGIHEPEPYEEFFAGGGTGRPEGDTPASSIYNGKDSHQSHSTSRSGMATKRTKDGREARDVYRDYLEDNQHTSGTPSRSRNPARRSVVPPPQPIFVPDAVDVLETSPPMGSPSPPKRSKSLMHRIRKMRDAPNVPVSAGYDEPPSPASPTEHSYPGASGNSGRPTHRSQNSFLGRLAGNSRTHQTSPSMEKPEPYIYIDPHTNKDLPATPRAGNTEDVAYFDNSGTQGLGRKTSLMKKVGRVVRGTR
ncbi:hypothetical protein BD779DRAFT_1464894 [Infundibulicybe gibba]|nr:hypothetical protein BD779DRAFT_1464894 [Infundibulicybe gibba]